MSLNKILAFMLVLVSGLQFTGCGTLPQPKKISPQEQLKIDSARVKGLLDQFEKSTSFQKISSVEKYLSAVAVQIANVNSRLKGEGIRVRIHRDDRPALKQSYAFPGILISVPNSLLQKVEFENELAALIAFQLANIDRRLLAKNLDEDANLILSLELNRTSSFSQKDLEGSVELGVSMLYSAGFDPRGMVSVFEKYPTYFFDLANPDSEKNRLACIKQAKKSKNDFIPSLQPIVRSNEFLKMKRDLKGST